MREQVSSHQAAGRGTYSGMWELGSTGLSPKSLFMCQLCQPNTWHYHPFAFAKPQVSENDPFCCCMLFIPFCLSIFYLLNSLFFHDSCNFFIFPLSYVCKDCLQVLSCCLLQEWTKARVNQQHPPAHDAGWMMWGKETLFCCIPAP
jgi:hypothetical protein